MPRAWTLLIALSAVLVACGDSDGLGGTSPDASTGDAAGEAGREASAGTDSAADAAASDSAIPDSGVADSAILDSAIADSGIADSAIADSAIVDSAIPDAGTLDSGANDAGVPSTCGDTRGLQPGAPWPMRGRCPTRIARADVAGPARVNLRWSQRIGPSATDLVNYGSVVSAPVVAADGTIYVGTQGTGSVPSGLLAFNSDGSPKWHYDTSASSVRSGGVIRADGSVVFASSDGTVTALETTGQKRWSTSAGAQAFGSPLIGPDGTIYIGTQSGLTALHADGTAAWSKPGCSIGTGGASLLADGSVIYNCQGALMIATPSGATGSGNPSTTDPYQTIYAPPTIAGNTVWFGGLTSHQIGGISYYATLYSYSPATGVVKRQFAWDAGAFFNSPAILPNGDAVTGIPYPDNGNQGAIGAAPVGGGFSQWTAYSQRIQVQPSVDVDGNVYFVVGTTLTAVGPTGAPRWTAPLDSGVQMGIAIGADGTLYVGTVNGWLYAFAP